jgi:outer membrane lipoprotein-sorting protein
MRKLLLGWIFCALTLGTDAQHPGFKPLGDMTAFNAAFSAASKQTQSIKADFVQEKELSMLSEKISSKGKFWFKRNNRVRMEYTQPFQYLVVINNNNVFVKDGQKENRVSTKSNKVFQQINRLMVDCVRGTALSNPDFAVRVFDNANAYLIELSPVAKAMKDYFKNINIVVSKKDYAVNKLEMYEQSGDNTIISFTNRELNAAVSDALFAVN